MPTDELVTRLHQLMGYDPNAPQNGFGDTSPGTLTDSDSLIGLFQSLRPDGEGLDLAFDQIQSGTELCDRLRMLFDAARDDRRPQGGRDAYFVVRNPVALDPKRAEELTIDWLHQISRLASALGDATTANALRSAPAIRVLEGIPPKHPKREEEKSELLKTFENGVATLTSRIESADRHAIVLRQAYYFVACDPMLRDYLMWPLYSVGMLSPDVAVADPFSPYFQLWIHGVKYRIFGETQIDVYLPRG